MLSKARRLPLPIAVLATALLVAPAVSGDDDSPLDQWPAWRGPLASGVAPRGNPPTSWDEESNVRWRLAIPGEGSSSPVIWGDRIFLLTAVRTERVDESKPKAEDQPERLFGIKFPREFFRFAVVCVSRERGEILWQTTVRTEVPHEGRHPDNDYASSSPVTDGESVWVSFGSRGIYRLDVDGKQIWERDLGDMETRRSFGEGASPALWKGALIVPWDHDGPSKLFVLDAASGETRWSVDRDEVTTWATPLVVEHQGVTHVVVPATNRTRSYDLATGDLLWECGGQVSNVTPSPVHRDGVVYCMSGYRGASVQAIALAARGDVTGSSEKVLWSRDRDAPYVASPLLYDDHLYFTKSLDRIVTCVDAATGAEILPTTRLPALGRIYASPVGAAGRVYLTGRDGTTVVIAKGPKLEVLAENSIGEPVDASAAIVGNQLFLRGARHLWCLEERPDGSSEAADGD